MAFHTLLDAVLSLIGLASTVTVVSGLVSGLQHQFERMRDSCRALEPPEGRLMLLWSVFIIQIEWAAAAVLYYHNLLSLWDTMGAWLESQPVNRPVYALLHFYLFFLLACGLYALAITISKIAQIRKVFNDLLMIARFNTRKYQAVEDTEAQHSSSIPDLIDAETEEHSAVGNVRNTTLPLQDESLRGNAHDRIRTLLPLRPASVNQVNQRVRRRRLLDSEIIVSVIVIIGLSLGLPSGRPRLSFLYYTAENQ